MRTSLVVTTLCVVGAGAISAGATFATQNYAGSDTLFDLTNTAINSAHANLGGNTDYTGGGSGAGENAMVASAPTQWTAPMSKMLTSSSCTPSLGPTHASGVVIGLDAVDVYSSVFSGATSGCSQPSNAAGLGLAYNTSLQYTDSHGAAQTLVFKNWTDVLALLYGGLDKSQNGGSGTSATGYVDCNSPQRQALAANWANLFEAQGTTCTTNPSSTCTTAKFHTFAGNVALGGVLRHALRRDDASGTSDAFASIVGLGSLFQVNNGAAGPVLLDRSGKVLSYSVSATKNKGFGVTPYCNAMNWDTTAANEPTATSHCALHAFKQLVGPGGIPQLFCSAGGAACDSGSTVGQTCNGTGTCQWDGIHKRPPQFAWGDLRDPAEGSKDIGADVLPTAFQDNDPIRRPCVGFVTIRGQNQPAEDICNIDNPNGPGSGFGGQLGLVLPMPEVDWITSTGSTNCAGGTACPTTAIFPTAQCTAFGTGTSINVPFCATSGVNNQVCPNDAASNGGCTVPTDSTGSSFCLSDPGGWNLSSDPVSNDARIFNLAAYDGSSTGGPIIFNIPGSTSQTSFMGGFSRLHLNYPLWDKSKSTTPPTLPGGQAQGTCTATDMTDQIACLTQADPCSVGYAGDGGKAWNTHQGRTLAVPGTDAMEVSQVYPTTAGVQSGTYPFWRKLYFNSSNGFDTIPASFTDTQGSADDGKAELALGQYESNTASITSLLSTFNFFSLGHSPNGGGDQPFCEDFNEVMLCGASSNAFACHTNLSALSVAANSAAVNKAASSNIPGDTSTDPANPTTSTVCGNGKLEAFEDCDWSTGSTTCSKTCRVVLP